MQQAEVSLHDSSGCLISAVANRGGAFPSPDRIVEREEVIANVKKAVAKLPYRERRVLQRRFGIGVEDQTLSETANEFGVCPERIRQIETKALVQLRHDERLGGENV